MKKITKLLISSILLLSLVACSSNDDTSTSDEPVVQEVTVVTNYPGTIDVNDIRNSNEIQIISHVQEGLFRILQNDEGLDELTLAGAESYTVSDDGLVYTFTLRDHNWSDGVPVTAQHYVDSIIRLLTPENAFSYAFIAYDIENGEAFYNGEATAEDVGVRAIDDKTLEITLGKEVPYFTHKLTNLCFFPIRLDTVEAAGESYLTDYEQHVFNGPFVIESGITGNEMVLAKNEQYWDAENVTLEKIYFKEVAEQSTQSIMLDNDELDIALATTDYYDKWEKDANEGLLVQTTVTAPSVTYLAYNQHTGGLSGLMNNENIRLALSLAIDRDEYNELIYNGLYTPAYGLIPPGVLVGDTEFASYNETPLKALSDEYLNDDAKLQALFDEGLKEEGTGLAREDVVLEIFTASSTAQTKSSLEYLQQTWENKLGISVKITIFSDTSLFVEARNSNEYDLVIMGWGGDFNDPMTFFEIFETGNGYAKFMGGYSNEVYDETLTSLDTTSDNAERLELYKALEDNLIVENSGVAPITYTTYQFFQQPDLHNVSYGLFGPDYDLSRAYKE